MPLLLPDIEQEVARLKSVAEALEGKTRQKRISNAAMSFFNMQNIANLEEDIEAVEELRDICARQRGYYEEPLDRVLDLLRDFQDTCESMQID